MEKISFELADGGMQEFYVLEQTVVGGVSYILVTDSDEGDAEAFIMKDLSSQSDEEAIYEIVDNDLELEAISKIFQEIMEDVEIDLS